MKAPIDIYGDVYDICGVQNWRSWNSTPLGRQKVGNMGHDIQCHALINTQA